MTHRFPILGLRLLPLLAAFALLAALTAVACSDDDEVASTATPPPPPTVTAAATASPNRGAGDGDRHAGARDTYAHADRAARLPADHRGLRWRRGDPSTRRRSASSRTRRAATEIVFAVGAGDRVVATDEFSYYPPEAQELPKLAYSSPDPERALTLAPDLVLMASQQREQIEQFRNLGMTVLFIDSASSLDGVFETIEQVGRITGNREQADALVASMRARIDAVTDALESVEEGPRTFFELTADLYTVGPDTFVGDVLALAKARNVATGAITPFPQLTAEAIIAADPEVVLLADGAWGESLETVCARPGWAVTSACINERVHPVDGDLTSRPGPRVVEGLEQIVRLLYPDRFE